MASVSATQTITSQPPAKKKHEEASQHRSRGQQQQRKGAAELDEEQLTANGRLYEYTSAANPTLPRIPVLTHPPSLHTSGANNHAREKHRCG
jgi:hypothetical protein